MTACCSEGVPGATGADRRDLEATRQHLGEALRQGGRGRPSVPSTRSTSRYSASDSWPVERARPKWSLGRGEKPSLRATGSSARRSTRSQIRARSRWLVKRTLPRLGEADADAHQPTPAGGGPGPERRPGPPPRRGPAGALAAAGGRGGVATTCSMPYPVQAPQS